ncbi:FMN-binding negative transcriptional regulator [bacterium]|nr:MAG: FMN-binding negative transcriptional regulator [bacterium]
MYIPQHYKNEDTDAVRAFIHGNGFAILVSQVDAKPWATHIPLYLDKNSDGKDVLIGHISRSNKQWKDFDKNEEVLAIFSGPHAYVSSSWYDHENVPTWNYLAVHVYGNVRIVAGEQLKDQLGKLVDKYESGMQNPVSVNGMSKEFVDREMRGIVGFEIEITRIQAAMKLSQNRDENNYDRVVKALEAQGDMDSVEIAKLMKKRK